MNITPTVTAPTTSSQPTPLVPSSTSASSGGLSFGDVLDAVNPLQHIPFVSSLYRAATGSQISSASQLAGDTLYGALMPGGVIASFATSLADVAVKEVTGKNIGQYIVGAVTPSSTSSPSSQTTVSSSQTATPLVPATFAAQAANATQALNIPAVPYSIFNRNTQLGNGQYQRAQALDAINSKLVKIKI